MPLPTDTWRSKVLLTALIIAPALAGCEKRAQEQPREDPVENATAALGLSDGASPKPNQADPSLI